MDRRERLLSWAIYVLLALNLATLWFARGDYVPGWDLFGATFGVLALGETGSFAGAVQRVWAAVLAQRDRSVFTGGESFVHGLLPGLLNELVPWLKWGHVVGFVLTVAVLVWLARRLAIRPYVLWACVLASPALVSQAIVGLPHLSSTAVPFGLVIGHCIAASRRPRPLPAGILQDVVVLAAVTLYAFNGYESGKTFWVVLAIATVTLPGIPLARRLVWLGGAIAAARLAYVTQAATTVAALASVPRDAWAFLAGLARIPSRYLVDWWIDFPALLLAVVPGLLLLRRERLFWTTTLLAAAGLVSLSAFQFDGGFLSPHRFLLLIFVCAIIVASALDATQRTGPLRAFAIALVAAGIGYTTFTTIRFAVTPWTYEVRNYNGKRIYALPYNHSGFENQLWLDRIHDAVTAVDFIRSGDERHLFLYGFSVVGEDGVNPQLFVSRLLLPLGYRRFSQRVAFFDHVQEMFFRFPIRPLSELPAAFADTSPPFFLHVREPDHSGPSIVARYLNAATVTPVDLGLIGFRSYRVTAYAPPGPIPIQPPDAEARARIIAASTDLADGFCLTTWRQAAEGHSPLQHWEFPLPTHLDSLLKSAAAAPDPSLFADVERRRMPEVAMTLAGAHVAELVAYFDNQTGAPMPAELTTTAGDEVGVVLNGQTLVETLSWRERTSWQQSVVLPPGMNELQVLFHRFFTPGRVSFGSVGPGGASLRWRCPAAFGRPPAS